MKQYHIVSRNQQLGPFAESEVRQMLEGGDILSSDLYWREGMTEWRPLTEMNVESGVIFCTACGEKHPENSYKCTRCGAHLHAVGAPVYVADGTMRGWIPYQNKPALIGYYLAIFSLIPVIGLPLGIAALILGIVGFRAVRKNPAIRGVAHAWVAIILGLLTSVGYILLLTLLQIFIHQ